MGRKLYVLGTTMASAAEAVEEGKASFTSCAGYTRTNRLGRAACVCEGQGHLVSLLQGTDSLCNQVYHQTLQG